jgi:hypothetical protein
MAQVLMVRVRVRVAVSGNAAGTGLAPGQLAIVFVPIAAQEFRIEREFHVIQ